MSPLNIVDPRPPRNGWVHTPGAVPDGSSARRSARGSSLELMNRRAWLALGRVTSRYAEERCAPAAPGSAYPTPEAVA